MNLLLISQDYPYLSASVLMFLLCLVAGRLLLPPQQFRATIFSGLLNAPCCLFTPLLEKSYWSPKRAGGWILGIEDPLISYVVAAMAWLSVAFLLRNRLAFCMPAAGFFRRYNTAAGMSVALFLAMHLSGLDAMTALIVTCGVMAVCLQILRRDLWPLSLTGFLGFPILYLLIVKLDFWLWPESIFQWNPGWGQTIFGLPLGEILWAVVFAVYWPLFFGYTFNLKVIRPRLWAQNEMALVNDQIM